MAKRKGEMTYPFPWCFDNIYEGLLPLKRLADSATPRSIMVRAASPARSRADARAFSSLAEKVDSTQSARSKSGLGFAPTPIFTRGKVWLPISLIMDFIPL